MITALWIAVATSAEATLSLQLNTTNTTVALVGSGTAQIPSAGVSAYVVGSNTGNSQSVNLDVSSGPLTAQLQIFEGGGLRVSFFAGDSDGVDVIGSGVGTSYDGAYNAVLESFQGSSLTFASGTYVGPLSVAVPEPSSLVLSSLLVIFMCTIRRRGSLDRDQIRSLPSWSTTGP